MHACTYSKVHISKATLKSLRGAYYVEPGNGGTRNTILEEKNIETFFVVSTNSNRANSQVCMHVYMYQFTGVHACTCMLIHRFACMCMYA